MKRHINIILVSHKDSKEVIDNITDSMRRKGTMAFNDKDTDNPDDDYELEKDKSLFE